MSNGSTDLDVTPPTGSPQSPGEVGNRTDLGVPSSPARDAGVTASPSRQTLIDPEEPFATGVMGEVETLRGAPSANVAQSAPRPLARIPRFLGEYEIVEEIARGGMGVVYRARQDKLNRVVALKLIRDSSLAGPADLRRFQADAQALAQLDHPHIVPIYEIGQIDDQPYFSMRLIAGGNLTDHIPRLKQDTRAAAALIAKVARAVHYAHQRMILHRDIKPSNILLDEAGEPYVTDFGLAKRIGPDPGGTAATVAGMVMGTPAFMPPEQARGDSRSVTTAADVYSLGATLYTALTGQPPFAGDSAAEIIRQVLDQEPGRPRSIDPKLDRDLETICLKCLDKEPARRYGSADALAEDLERWLSGMPIKARPVPPWEKVVKWVKRQRVLAGSLMMLLVALLGLIGGAVWFTLELRQERDMANRGQYAVDMNLARRALDDGLIYQVREQLKTYRTGRRALADLRGFEWYYLANLCDPAPIRLRGHEKSVISVAFHPDGRRVVSGGADGSVRVWDLNSRKELHVFPGTGGVVHCVAVSLDGHWMAAGDTRGGLRLWELGTGRDRALVAHQSRIASVAFSPDGSSLLSCDAGRRIVQWSVKTGERDFELRHVHHSDAVAPIGSPTNGLEPVGPFAAYLSDGKTIVSAGLDQWVMLWDVARPRKREEIQVSTNIIGFAISPNRAELALAEQKHGIEILDLEKPNGPRRPVPGISRQIVAVAYSPIGETIAMSSFGEGAALFDLGNGRILDRYNEHVSMSPSSLSYAPNGQMLALSVGNEIHVIRANRSRDGATVATGLGPIVAFAASPDERQLALARKDGTIVVWDVRGRRPLQTLTGHELAVFGVAFVPRPQGAWLVSVGADGLIKLWDPESGGPTLCPPARRKGAVNAVDVRPDGHQIATGGVDGLVCTWDPDTGRADLPPIDHGASVSALAYAPADMALASGGMDGTVRVWSATSGSRQLGPLVHPHPVTCLAFSPDRRLLAAGGGAIDKGGKILIWDAWSGAISATVDCPRGVESMSFSSDSRRIATCGSDAVVQVWDATGGHETLSLIGHTDRASAVLFAPHDHRLYSAGRDGVVKRWEGGRIEPSE